MHPARDGVGLLFATACGQSGTTHRVACEGEFRLSGNQSGGAQDNEKRPARSPKDRKLDKANVVGRALRTVYDETLREDIPDDFLDLLGKLD